MSKQAILYRSAFTTSPKVDVDQRIINDVIMCQTGEAKGHGHSIELEFIEAMVTYAQKKLKSGVPSDFGHNWDSMGKQLGIFKNIRLEGTKALGDLHIYNIADDSPTHPKMGTWLLGLAKEDKKRVNASIKFEKDYYYQKDSAGQKVKVWYWDEDDRWVRPIKELGKIFVAFKALKGCDIVGDGAATNTLYSAGDIFERFNDLTNEIGFTEMLEEHSAEFPILNDHFAKKHGNSFINYIKNLIQPHPGADHTYQKPNKMAKETKNDTQNQDELTIEQKFEKLTADFEELQAKLNDDAAADDEPTEKTIEQKYEALVQKYNDLEAKVEAFGESAAAEGTKGAAHDAVTPNTEDYMNLDIHKKVEAYTIPKTETE